MTPDQVQMIVEALNEIALIGVALIAGLIVLITLVWRK